MIHYQDRWAVVTGASSGLGRGLAARLADRGMSLVLTGRNEVRLNEAAHQIRLAAPRVAVETVAADLSTRAGVSALLDRVGDRPIEVLVNNAGFGSYGPFAEADPDREAEEVAVDVIAVIALARAFLPGMLARRSGGILNVASTIAFQPAPYQAVYGASKAFVLSFSEALWAEARAAGVAVTALCPGPTRTGFVDALGADVGHTAIYSRLAEPEPVIEAGLRALDKGRAVVIPGLRNKVIAASGRFMPREWLTLFSGRLLRPVSAASRPPIEVHNEIVIPASAERVWDLLADVEKWPSWYRACKWVRVESTGHAASTPGAARPAVLPVEGTPGRAAQHRGRRRSTAHFRHRCGRPRAARRAHVHAPPHAQRPGYRRRQPRNPGRAAPVAWPRNPGAAAACGQPGDVRGSVPRRRPRRGCSGDTDPTARVGDVTVRKESPR